MEVAQDCKSTGEHTGQRPRVYLEYLIDCPPCPREQRKQHLLPAAAVHRRHQAASSSKSNESTSRRSLPATPTTEAAAPDFLVDDDRQRPAEFQRRLSPFRRGAHERVRRAASATPTTSEQNSTTNIITSRPSPVEQPRTQHADGGLEDTGVPRQLSLQQMIRHRRSTSNSSNGSNSVLNEPQQPQQVRVHG